MIQIARNNQIAAFPKVHRIHWGYIVKSLVRIVYIGKIAMMVCISQIAHVVGKVHDADRKIGGISLEKHDGICFSDIYLLAFYHRFLLFEHHLFLLACYFPYPLLLLQFLKIDHYYFYQLVLRSFNKMKLKFCRRLHI